MERIKAIIEGHCLKEIGEMDELLKSKLLGSFQLLEVICELEETYGIELSPEEIGNLDHFSSLNNIRQLISEKLACMTDANGNMG